MSRLLTKLQFHELECCLEPLPVTYKLAIKDHIAVLEEDIETLKQRSIIATGLFSRRQIEKEHDKLREDLKTQLEYSSKLMIENDKLKNALRFYANPTSFEEAPYEAKSIQD